MQKIFDICILFELKLLGNIKIIACFDQTQVALKMANITSNGLGESRYWIKMVNTCVSDP